jgi:citrate synthase
LTGIIAGERYMENRTENHERLIQKLSESIKVTSNIEKELFDEYKVKRGLRNSDHTGVLVGLTKIGSVLGYVKKDDGTLEPIDGKLIYRGINVTELVEGCQKGEYHGFEETAYLLISGKLPTREELSDFHHYLAEQRKLPSFFTKQMILPLRGKNIMNMLSTLVMALYNDDDNADDTSRENLMKQSLNLIAKFPTIVAYAYQSMMHSHYDKTLAIRHPMPELSTAENFLWMMKGEKYTPLEADVLDLALIIHAEHGGGNNSTFTIRVTSSSGTDTYSAITSAIGSLKGPLHGGANIAVQQMLEYLKKEVNNWKSQEEVSEILLKILKKEAFDKAGKIYGIGHAIYTKSDPRAVLLKAKARELAIEKDRMDEFNFLDMVERTALKVFKEFRGNSVHKTMCANVDFYSGFVYNMIGLPQEVYTPLFAISRVTGWCAHRIEELNFSSKRIIRPAYKNVYGQKQYMPLEDR